MTLSTSKILQTLPPSGEGQKTRRQKMGTLPSEGEAGDLSGSVAALPELPDPLGLETNELMTKQSGGYQGE